MADDAEPFIGEIRFFGGNFAPAGWAFCDGSEMPIAQNTTLYAMLGTTYGGSGTSTFRLPDLRGRAAMHHGQGPGLTNRALGAKLGTETVGLTEAQLPGHKHPIRANVGAASTTAPAGAVYAGGGAYASAPGGTAETMNAAALDLSGGANKHPNTAPSLVANYIIALQGITPPHSG